MPFDVLLYNPAGQITETSIANFSVKLGEQWITPKASCGLLPGVMRAELLELGLVHEGIITIDGLVQAAKVPFATQTFFPIADFFLSGWFTDEMYERHSRLVRRQTHHSQSLTRTQCGTCTKKDLKGVYKLIITATSSVLLFCTTIISIKSASERTFSPLPRNQIRYFVVSCCRARCPRQ
jgi:hypothetical protein